MVVGLTFLFVRSDDVVLLNRIAAAAARDPVVAAAAAKLLADGGDVQVQFAGLSFTADEPGHYVSGWQIPTVTGRTTDEHGKTSLTMGWLDQNAPDLQASVEGDHAVLHLVWDEREAVYDDDGAATLAGDPYDWQLSISLEEAPLSVVVAPDTVAVFWARTDPSPHDSLESLNAEFAEVRQQMDRASSARDRRRLVDALLDPPVETGKSPFR